MACASPAARYRDAFGNPLVRLNQSIGHNHWFLFVIVTAFIFTFLWSCFYFLQLKDSINMKLPFSWLKLVSRTFEKNCFFLFVLTLNAYYIFNYVHFCLIGIVLHVCGHDFLCSCMDSSPSWIRILCRRWNM